MLFHIFDPKNQVPAALANAFFVESFQSLMNAQVWLSLRMKADYDIRVEEQFCYAMPINPDLVPFLDIEINSWVVALNSTPVCVATQNIYEYLVREEYELLVREIYLQCERESVASGFHSLTKPTPRKYLELLQRELAEASE